MGWFNRKQKEPPARTVVEGVVFTIVGTVRNARLDTDAGDSLEIKMSDVGFTVTPDEVRHLAIGGYVTWHGDGYVAKVVAIQEDADGMPSWARQVLE